MGNLERVGDPVRLPVTPEGLRPPEDGQALQLGIVEVVKLRCGGDALWGHE